MMPWPQITYILAPTLLPVPLASLTPLCLELGQPWASNEFMISNIHHLNIPALTTLTNGTGILLQHGGANADWVEASGGTYNLVEKIDNAISALQSNSSLSTTGPFVPTFSSEVNCTAASVNSGFSYYGEDFYNLYMLFTVDVTGLSVSSFSVDKDKAG